MEIANIKGRAATPEYFSEIPTFYPTIQITFLSGNLLIPLKDWMNPLIVLFCKEKSRKKWMMDGDKSASAYQSIEFFFTTTVR